MAVFPVYYPVDNNDVSLLENVRAIPVDLKKFWATQGIGFFSHDANGEIVNDFAANNLLSPNEIIDILENAYGDDLETYERGLPFFERYDLCYFLITASGQVVNEYNDKVTVIADSIDDFVSKLNEDSSFYESLLEEEIL